MKILMVNKFLYPNGGSETYMFNLGAYLEKAGHEIQYFGMEHTGRIVGNRVEAYTSDMDFHAGGLSKITYAIRTIYSREARRKIRRVLDDFEPEVVHLNNFHYQLTPSIILEIADWRQQRGKHCRILYTAHDYQLVCPNHMMRTPAGKNCTACLMRDGKQCFGNCLKNKCIHGSALKSAVAMTEARYWNRRGIYRYIDQLICCSRFMKKQLDTNPLFLEKTVAIHNFITAHPGEEKHASAVMNTDNGNATGYVLYFGRFSTEKGIRTLLQVCRSLPEVPFVFAGTGPLEQELEGIANIRNVGFQKGADLRKLIRQARFTVYPSEWYENCPLSVMESIALGTPVIGARIGGIPELVEDGKTGILFESGNAQELCDAVKGLWEDDKRCESYTENCTESRFDDEEAYVKRLWPLYGATQAS